MQTTALIAKPAGDADVKPGVQTVKQFLTGSGETMHDGLADTSIEFPHHRHEIGMGIPLMQEYRFAQIGRQLQLPLTIAFYMLIVASLFVTEHILRETLECSRFLSIPLTVANLLLSLAVAQWFDQSARAA